MSKIIKQSDVAIGDEFVLQSFVRWEPPVEETLEVETENIIAEEVDWKAIMIAQAEEEIQLLKLKQQKEYDQKLAQLEHQRQEALVQAVEEGRKEGMQAGYVDGYQEGMQKGQADGLAGIKDIFRSVTPSTPNK